MSTAQRQLHAAGRDADRKEIDQLLERTRLGDRLLAAESYGRGVPLIAVENALLLAAARRLFRPADAPPLPTIRSLAYFSPVIDEVLHSHVSQEYFLYLRRKLEPFAQTAPARATHDGR